MLNHALKSVLLFLLLLLPAACASADTLKISDGDTFKICSGDSCVKIRLYGIDTPEKKQPYGPEARDYLSKLITGKKITYEVKATDRYKRSVCLVYADGLCVNKELVKAGYAWAYRQYLKGPYASEYIDSEREARAAKRGLWADSNPQPPWEYRKIKRGH